MFGKGGIGNLLKQTQQMQERMKQTQEELKKIEVEGDAGAGAVKVKMSGDQVVKRIQILDDSLLEDKDMLEDLISAAVNNAREKVEAQIQEKMGALTGGLQLPAGMEHFFK
jgi:DNA-binding protein, ybaB/ebfC family